jgi:hypothetical protein
MEQSCEKARHLLNVARMVPATEVQFAFRF